MAQTNGAIAEARDVVREAIADDGHPAPPSAADQLAAEAAADQTHFEQLAADAATARGSDYDGTLTAKHLVALDALLRKPTPAKYVKHVPPTEGKPYPSTGINSPQVQIDHMNAVLGSPHWRLLAHYEDDGYVCKVVVIVGNRLASATLDDAGELVSGDADILAVRDGWGGVKRGNHKGDVLKGSETNALKRALARFGPGGDVYRLDFDDENVGGTGSHEYQPTGGGGGGGVGSGSGARNRRTGPITEGQVRRIWGLNRNVRVGDRLNAVLHGTGQPVQQFPSEDAARRMLNEIAPTVDRQHIDAVFALIEQGGVAPQDPTTGHMLPSIAPPAPAGAPGQLPDGQIYGQAPAPIQVAPPTQPQFAADTIEQSLAADPATLQAPPQNAVAYQGPDPDDLPVDFGRAQAA